ncbi:hypothetical protein HK414_14000 [Ramlibacter terrae]|uniref:Calcium-binding protein n=1 Tax=Ramlibacter terrae TaxID=2732511 RepID=A0ABX6P405_9BURK|nr:hypothetical protein HK414_14000 [Ramlibacter terrae]
MNGTGNAADNVIYGNDGNNVIDGGEGADEMSGINGDDTYHVDNPGDTVKEWHAGGGRDRVIATVDWTLGGFVEELELAGSADLAGTGNADANLIIGNAGANALDGKAGADTLQGGAGDDVYRVGTGDVVVEAAGGGVDTVETTVSWVLGANVENLYLIGPAQEGTGNDGANSIIGNDGDNTLDGGLGADTLEGGRGDDTYLIGDTLDHVEGEAGADGGGWDTVIARANHVLDNGVEVLELAEGSAARNGTGNGGNNVLRGNSAANVLAGGAGIDQMLGGAGNDTYHVDHAFEYVGEEANQGTDTVVSSVSWTLHAHRRT